VKYGTPVFNAKVHFYKAVLQYYMYQVIKWGFRRLRLSNFFNNRMIGKGYYMTGEQIKKVDLL
jgi:uncharacterized protein YutD